MQILFAQGVEHGNHDGVGVWDATVEKLEAPILPHMGWNTVSAGTGSSLFKGVENESFYFVHSYAAHEVGIVDRMGQTTYGETFVSALELGNICGTQFHPEKSQSNGLLLLRNFFNKS